MLLVETILGNISDARWQSHLANATQDYLSLDQWEAQKNRFRKLSKSGQELAVSLDRNQHLRNGDILHWDEKARVAIIAQIQLNEVLVIQLSELAGQTKEILLTTCFELGHALGNQHWPAVVKGTKVYVPLVVDRKVMSSVMKTHAFKGITYEFVPGTEVIPYLAPHESRQLFGGANATPHTHAHSDAKGHSHTHTHTDAQGNTHTHSHDDGTHHHH